MARAETGTTRPTSRGVLAGVACGLCVALIWATWLVMTRAAVTTRLQPLDVTFLRYGVSSVLLLPYLWLRREELRRVRPMPALAMVAGAGLPFMFFSSLAMKHAPAAHGAIFQIAAMPVFVALITATLFRERLTRQQWTGLVLVVSGVCWLAAHSLANARQAWVGDLLFLCASLLFASFTVAQRRSGISPLLATALVNVASMLLFIGPYLWWASPQLLAIDLTQLLVHGLVQGVANAVLALLLFAEAVRRLGATRAAMFGALVPVLTLVLGMLLLGEAPQAVTVWAAAVVTVGVLVVLTSVR